MVGLNEQQARAYLALLDVETATANDIAKASRVPRAKLYEVLETLGRKGLLETIPETPQRFRANALTALYDTRLSEIRAEERQLKDTIGELMLQLLPGAGQPANEAERDFLHVSKGRTMLGASFRQLVERAEGRLLFLGDPLFLARLRMHEDWLQLLVRFHAKGDLRILVPANHVAALEGRRVHVDELADAIRILAFPGSDAMIGVGDEAEVLETHLIPNDLHPSRGSDRIVVNRDPAMARAIAAVIGAWWPTAKPYVSSLASR